MITKFKIYEVYKEPKNWYTEGEPRLNDYVILNINWYSAELNYFLNNCIGQICKLKKDTKNPDHIQYQIIYENVPEKFKKTYLQHNRFYVYKAQINDFSSNKEDLEAILAANKYNL
jgi:hypothetical protein